MENNRQALRLKKVCRGMGKIYALAELPKEIASYHLEVSSRTAFGTAVPAALMPYDENYRVLVLAVLDVSQTVTIVAVSPRRDETVVLTRVVTAKLAKLSSQVHTLLRDESMERIRNYDIRPPFGTFDLEVMRIVRTLHGEDVIQVNALCTAAKKEEFAGEYVVEALDGVGNPVSSSPCVILRDQTITGDWLNGCITRNVQFSVRMACDVNRVILWLHPANGVGSEGFLSMFQNDLGYWRNMWSEQTRPAIADPRYTLNYDHDWALSPTVYEVQRHATFNPGPLFSIIVPLYQTPLQFFDEMVQSVVNQSYGRFELILVNASPEDQELRVAIESWVRRDKRISVVELQENLGITENTNEGIRVAKGDFLCFLDHDDTLSPDALFLYAKSLEMYPDIDMFYSDEDHIEDGVYKNPYFKPDWEPDLLLGMNYICHFLAVRKSVVDDMELPTKEFDGSQDHHMALRVSERARRIFHCRRALYHWRIHPGSTANNTGEKPYAIEAGRLAVQAHLDRCGVNAQAVHSKRVEGRYEVEYTLDRHPLVSILIPNKDAASMLDRCLQSIFDKTDYDNYEIIIIENNSIEKETFAYYDRIQELSDRVRVVRYKGGFNYSKINNFGAEFANGEYLLLLNNDIEVISEHWISRMVALCMRESTGIVGAKLLFPDDTIQHAGVICLESEPAHVNRFLDRNDPGYVETLTMMQDVSAVTGACLMTKRSVFEALGGLDAEFEVDYNDIDYCWRVRKSGYLVVFDPSVELYHYESISRGFHDDMESRIRFEKEKALLHARWAERFISPDPMGNPNFNQSSAYYRLR